MLISPRPGTNRENLLDALWAVSTDALNVRAGHYEHAYDRLLRYLEWAQDAARQLRNQISTADLTALVLTPRHDTLLNGVGHLGAAAQQRLVNALVDQELIDRVEAFDAAIGQLQERITEWTDQEWFVVADSSFYIQNPEPLAEADLHAILGLPPAEHIRLLFPIAVVDELDALKESGKHRSRWRAGHTLGRLDEVLDGNTFGILRRADFDGEPALWRGQVGMEIVLDQPGHVRLPIADDEIIDRAVAIQALSARPIRLLTCDTGQHTRGRAAGLRVTKVPAKDPGPEPDWEAQEKTGSGVRAQRRARQEARIAQPET
ncbi:PIN domain-containing protein [Streptomyces puniciscabiei]|uniref:PIN domain-containing protein n=1 Tax=Streptomyces puniciscabiei TaxID=164348 RepID=UPI003317CDB8